MMKPIINNTSVGQCVYDPFLGSGTTMIAAEKIDRICIGVELDPSYCDIAVQRWVDCRNRQGLDSSVMKNGEKCEYFKDRL